LRSPWGGKGRKAPAWWCEAACSCTTVLIPSLYCQLLWATYSTTHAWINTISDCCYCYLLLEILYCNILTPHPAHYCLVRCADESVSLEKTVWVYDNNYMVYLYGMYLRLLEGESQEVGCFSHYYFQSSGFWIPKHVLWWQTKVISLDYICAWIPNCELACVDW
jgi:hypothetical protein